MLEKKENMNHKNNEYTALNPQQVAVFKKLINLYKKKHPNSKIKFS